MGGERYIKAILRSKSAQKCTKCNTILDRIYEFEKPPVFIPLTIENGLSLNLEHFTYMYGHKYRLIGMIYFRGYHFTARIIDANGDIWYHDGIKTERNCLGPVQLHAIFENRDFEKS